MADDEKSKDPSAPGDGTLITPDQTAIVVDSDGTWRVLLPDDESGNMPPEALALIAAATRLTSDEAFYKDVLEWYIEQHGLSDEEEPQNEPD